MINALIDYSARNRFLVLLLVFFATAWGVRAMFRVPLDAIPDLSDPQVIVFSEWPDGVPNWWKIRSPIRLFPPCFLHHE